MYVSLVVGGGLTAIQETSDMDAIERDVRSISSRRIGRSERTG
jgi:hypothetical protein